MKRWALLVVALYGLILAVLAIPVIALACVDAGPLKVIGDIIGRGGVWLCVAAWCAVMMLAQAALLAVPVRLAGQRPVRRRHVFWTILAAFFLLFVMAAAMCLGVEEIVAHNQYYSGWEAQVFWGSIVVGFWLLWSLLMGFYVGNRDPKTMMSRLARFLIAGSILELLVAVPTHIIARSRGYCCAGFGTFWGLAAGLSVALFAFGPATLVLILRRWQSVRNPKPPTQAETKNET